jgi:abequosyltransferase
MQNKISQLLLSICIPTRGRADILIGTLESIFRSKSDPLFYEVVIYDSSIEESIEPKLRSQFDVPNLRYVKGENFGYLNLIEAMKLGSGQYLKMHNDYSIFEDGSIDMMIQEIEKHLQIQTLLVFTNGSLRKLSTISYPSFNDFMFELSFYSTWSNVFGMWKQDLDLLSDKELNSMFPHTSLLFFMSDKTKYVINDTVLFENVDIHNKGGYNLFHVFGHDYLGMIEACRKDLKISALTFEQIKTDMLYNFFIPWYSQTKILKNSYTFSLTDIKKSIRTYYSEYDYFKMIILAYKRSIRGLLNQVLRK